MGSIYVGPMPAHRAARMRSMLKINVADSGTVRLGHAVIATTVYEACSASESTACLNLSAFLISTPETYGYSPYSRKLGNWWSRTNLIKAGGLVAQSSGKPSRFSNDVCTLALLKIATASSVYLSKSVSNMP